MAKAKAKTKTKRGVKVTVKPVTQISVKLTDKPGELANIAEALAAADVSIDGVGVTHSGGKTVIDNLVVDNVPKAKKVLSSRGKRIATSEILKFYCADDRPGVIAAIARKLANGRVNIENAFHASTGRGEKAVFYVAVRPSQFKKALKLAKQIR